MESPNPYAAPAVEQAMELSRLPEPTVAGALAAGMTIYLQRFPAVAAITLVIWGPIELLLEYHAFFLAEGDGVGSELVLEMIVEGLFGIIYVAALTALGAKELRGERLSWWQALGSGLDAWPRMFASRLIAGIAVVFGLVFFALPGLYLGVRFVLSDCTATLERQNGMNALRRSMELTEGAFWRFFGLCAATIGALIVAQLGISVGVEMTLLLDPPLNAVFALAALSGWLIDLIAAWGVFVFAAAYVACKEEERRKSAPLEAKLVG